MNLARRLIYSALLLTAVLSAPAFAQAPVCTVAKVGTPSASISFVAPTLDTNGVALVGPITYNVYQGTITGGETKVASGLVGSPIAVTLGLTGGKSYYWYVTAVNVLGESAPSNEVCKTFPSALPGTVTITIT